MEEELAAGYDSRRDGLGSQRRIKTKKQERRVLKAQAMSAWVLGEREVRRDQEGASEW